MQDNRFRDASSALASATDADDIYRVLVDSAREAFGCDVCRLLKVSETGDELVPRASSDGESIHSTGSIPLDRGITGEAFRTGSVSAVDDLGFTRSASGDAEERPSATRWNSMLTVPVGEYSVLQAFDRDRGAFDCADAEWAEELATVASAALERIHAADPDDGTGDRSTADERVEEIVGAIAHDLQSPLSVAEGYLDLVQEDLSDESDHQRHLERIAGSIDRVEKLVDDMRHLARNDREASADVDLEDLARSSWAVVSTGDAELVVEGGLRFRASPSSVGRLIENLFGNAIEHAGPDVTVRVGPLDGEDGFYVEDDGPGIPEERREDAFELGVSTTPDGSGFGLAIVDRIVEKHGWDVRLGESADGGARFEIRGVEVV